MCGRFNLRTNLTVIADTFGVKPRQMELPLRFNIAPTQDVLAIRQGDQERELFQPRWGLIPSWAKDPSIGNRMINARCETVAEKPSFRSAFKRRRCLIPATGFYEWKGKKSPKQPFHIHMQDDSVFGFAGLWETWKSPDGPTESCTIITTEPNSLTAEIHDRMPVILHEDDYTIWLTDDEPDELRGLLMPYPADEMVAEPVSRHVSNARNEGPECLNPA
ncbi:SOS response-associated peptidase [Thalassoroseus pseudoceratinae]|uniref:SOS response-associated peptidase n=1 Tax=Thalassoroseus pseudoceratinae TaxID=2713176 RepID=UPI0014239E91|nr:SOS response-associated peptidase [Thalassoroseus pseudoceratinae]